MVDKKEIKLHKLLASILSISVLGFGGGAAVIPLFHKEIIEKYHYLDDDEFQDILSVANALPGPIQTKLAGYIGYRLKGFWGLFLSLLCIILPSLLLMLFFYNTINYFKDQLWLNQAISSVFPVVTSMMLMLTINFMSKSFKQLKIKNSVILLTIDFLFMIVLQMNPALIILITLGMVFVPKINEIKRFVYTFIALTIVYLLGYFNVIGIILSQNLDLSSSLNDIPNLLKLSIAFFIPGMIGYGGGPGSLSLISFEIVDQFHLLSSDQFALAVAIQGALPGVTATKLAGTIGYQISGILGSIISILVYVIPSMILMVSLLNILNKYKQTAVVKRLTSYLGPIVIILLANLSYSFFDQSLISLGLLQTLIFIVISLVLLVKFKLHPFFMIILAMSIGALLTL